MTRLKLLATATLVALAFTACDEGTPPPVEPPPPPTPVGTISGSVTIEGTAAAGITATLSSGATTTTGSGGNFAFSGVEAGTYTVTISGFPEDATFAQVTQSATIATEGQNVQLNFAGEYIRSSAVVGSVVAADAMMSGGDGQPETLAGVTVTLDGEHAMGETMETGMDGGFAFTGLRAGTYTVTISDFPEDVSFETVSVEVEVDVGDVGQADFTGHYIRTSAVEGQVIIDGEGLAGVTVTLAGGPSDERHTMMTDADGMYRFEDLRPGDYTVSISDFDTRDYEFAATSQDVSVDLDETGTVSFTGVLLRTSGISGRVSVEGMGLDNIAVTLSGAADASTMTDAGGQYSFAGLAAGDYTVTIAVESAAYVFDSMSQDRTVGDDESAIVNFDGQHARTASVSGQLFLDELDKNDMHDAGEHPLPAPGVPVALVGPGVNDQRLSATNAAGQFSFPGLRAGSYQLVVPIDATAAAALAANDIAYGGPGVGYAFDLGVGETKMQGIPFDITHTTINVAVTLKGGEYRGDPIPGASVAFYSGDSMVGSGETMVGEAGVYASIKVARADTDGNTVQMMVGAEGYFMDPDAGMQDVTWDPQSFVHPAADADPPVVLNDADIVNLNVNVNVNGETVTTDYGGGEALAGWEINVTSGGEAVAGAPTMLDDDGNASFMTVVAPDALPATFSFAAAEDQDDDLDGGEMYEASGGMYVHTGLKLAGTAMDATPMVVTYTTQTLKLYVHQERDQVYGYTGNVGYGDVRASDLVDIQVRQATGNGSATAVISRDDWDAASNSTDKDGAYTFSHLPADMDVVVRAVARDGYQLLDLARLDAYRNMEENGVMGGAFGDMGGFGHTVTLCPLTETEPTGQDFGKCGSFAVVSLHNVSGLVWKRSVAKSGTVFKTSDPTRVSGIEVSLTPIEGRNLTGVGADFTTAKSNDPTTAEDDRVAFSFDDMAAGDYELGIPDGWRARLGDKGSEDMLGNALSPLGDDVVLDITPSTATVYGFVRNTLGVGLEGINVSANGVETTTDGLGRYIAEGVSANDDDEIKVTTTLEGFPSASADAIDFMANTTTQVDVTRGGANATVAITGTVTEAGTNAPIKGVTITVDGKAPLNATGGKVTTGDDGSYTAMVQIAPNNDPLVDVKPSKTGYHFIPDMRQASAITGGSQNIDFTGYPATEIVGLVTGAGGGMPRAEVTVRAYDAATGGKKLDEVITTETGTFSLHVPTLSGTVYLRAVPQDEYDPTHANYLGLRDSERYDWYDPPANRPNGQIAVIPGQVLQFGTFTGNSVQPRIASIRRVTLDEAVEGDPQTIVPTARGFNLVQGEPTDTVVVTWHYETRNTHGDDGAGNNNPYTAADAADNAVLTTALGPRFTSFAAPSAGTSTPVSAIRGTRTRALPAGTPGRGTASNGTTVKHDRITTYIIPEADDDDYRELMAKIGHVVRDAGGADRDAAAALSDAKGLAGVPHGASGLEADRDIGGGSGADPVTDEISASWSGAGSPQLEHRIALYVKVETGSASTENRWEWVVRAPGATTVTEFAITRDTDPDTDSGADWAKWNLADYDLNLPANSTADEWADDDAPALVYTVTQANLRDATHIRVDTRVDDGGTWTKGTPAAIPEG